MLTCVRGLALRQSSCFRDTGALVAVEDDVAGRRHAGAAEVDADDTPRPEVGHVLSNSRSGASTLARPCPPRRTAAVPRRAKADPVAQRFGQAIRTAREEREETLEDVARRIPTMDAKYLGEIERGWHAPSIVTAKRIADALEVQLGELVWDP